MAAAAIMNEGRKKKTRPNEDAEEDESMKRARLEADAWALTALLGASSDSDKSATKAAVEAVKREFDDVLETAKRAFETINAKEIFQDHFESVAGSCFAGSEEFERCVENTIKDMQSALVVHRLYKDTTSLRKRVIRDLRAGAVFSAEDAKLMLAPTRVALDAARKALEVESDSEADADDSEADADEA